jgi:magnesium-transporting ATPase (P-type)
MFEDSFIFKGYLFIILIVKLVFLYSSFQLFLNKKKNNKKNIIFFENLKEFTHDIFFILMSLLVMFLFIPSRLSPKPVTIQGETKTFLFVYGLLILVGIDYHKLASEFKFLIKEK